MCDSGRPVGHVQTRDRKGGGHRLELGIPDTAALPSLRYSDVPCNSVAILATLEFRVTTRGAAAPTSSPTVVECVSEPLVPVSVNVESEYASEAEVERVSVEFPEPLLGSLD